MRFSFIFQVRYRGIKGVLSVDPAMDERHEWAKKNCVKDTKKLIEKTLCLNVLFRPSQVFYYTRLEKFC